MARFPSEYEGAAALVFRSCAGDLIAWSKLPSTDHEPCSRLVVLGTRFMLAGTPIGGYG